MDGAEALQIEEQPVALAITMRSPKSCVTSFIYGVSPHPPHAPENSMSGRANRLPLTVSLVISSGLSATALTANAQLSACSFICFAAGCMTSAFSFAGQMSAQLPQPVQSSGLTCIVNVCPASSFPAAALLSKFFGASACSFSFNRNGRIHACGQIYEHWLHWIQFFSIHSGINAAIPRFSYAVVPAGNVPSASG